MVKERETVNPKKWECKVCGRRYCYLSGAFFHNESKHGGNAKFKDLRVMRDDY